MKKQIRSARIVIILALATVILGLRPALAAGDNAIDRDVQAALSSLYATTPAAKVLGEKAKAILVFPSIVKAGFIVGAQTGDGALLQGGKSVGYYNISAVSYGLQAGVQSFGYAMFLMTDAALAQVTKGGGFEVGVGPSIVVVDEGMAKSITTATIQDDIYAFIFGQQGLMAGVGLEGSKITRLNR